jgi:hypothetical protein
MFVFSSLFFILLYIVADSSSLVILLTLTHKIAFCGTICAGLDSFTSESNVGTDMFKRCSVSVWPSESEIASEV